MSHVTCHLFCTHHNFLQEWGSLNEIGFAIIYTDYTDLLSESKNPAYGRPRLSWPMRIVGQIQFWRGCAIYRSAPKSGLGPRKNADSVHAMVGTRSTQKCWLSSLRNTSPFLGLYSRSRSRSKSRGPSWWKSQNLLGQTNQATSWDKKNHATTWDKKKKNATP